MVTILEKRNDGTVQPTVTTGVKIAPYSPEHGEKVVDLIVGIQRNEFNIPITIDDQPDLLTIPAFYRKGKGNFWVALDKDQVVGTISLLDIGNGRAALRKMFVAKAYRGAGTATASHLLDRALAWSREQGIDEIFLGTTSKFKAAHRFYEKSGFLLIPKSRLPRSFPVMAVDTRFYQYTVRA
ncbi:MAG: GNAT family N-acetyltransferase [Desulfobacteraceae bacterium]|nr:GNAT family N-acetyltransferase [Desulfobacteraceae bacterium]